MRSGSGYDLISEFLVGEGSQILAAFPSSSHSIFPKATAMQRRSKRKRSGGEVVIILE